MIIRSHECVMGGLQQIMSGLVMTLFTAPFYGGTYQNQGAILKITKNCKMIPLKLGNC